MTASAHDLANLEQIGMLQASLGTRGRLLALALTLTPLTAQQAARTLEMDEEAALDALEHLCRLGQLTRTRQDGKRGRYARHEYRWRA